MTADEIQFYVRHTREISQWAKLEKRVHDLLREAVQQGAVDKAASLLTGESGDPEVDFYVRNRSLIGEWDALQVPAGQALHEELLAAARAAGCPVSEGKKGWTGARARSPEFDILHHDHYVTVEMAWTRQDLLSTRHGYPFPRIALVVNPTRWQGDLRAGLIDATRHVAHELGMTKRDREWVRWRMLDGISEHQDLPSYATQCVARFQNAAERIYPVLRDTVSSI